MIFCQVKELWNISEKDWLNLTNCQQGSEFFTNKKVPRRDKHSLDRQIVSPEAILSVGAHSWLFPFPMILIVKRKRGFINRLYIELGAKVISCIIHHDPQRWQWFVWLVSPWDQNENILWYFYVLQKVISKVEWS